LATQADVTLFSTGYGKYLDMGFGGFAYIKDSVVYRRRSGTFSEAALAEVVRRYKDAIAKRAPFEGGDESWLDLSKPQITWHEYRQRIVELLTRIDQHKKRINVIYENALPRELQLPGRFQQWRFNIRVPEADRLVKHLFTSGLFASRHYAPVTDTFSERTFPVAEELHESIVNLFNDWHYDETKACLTTQLILEHLSFVDRR
jgi:hypothetical protein